MRDNPQFTKYQDFIKSFLGGMPKISWWTVYIVLFYLPIWQVMSSNFNRFDIPMLKHINLQKNISYSTQFLILNYFNYMNFFIQNQIWQHYYVMIVLLYHVPSLWKMIIVKLYHDHWQLGMPNVMFKIFTTCQWEINVDRYFLVFDELNTVSFLENLFNINNYWHKCPTVH